MDDIFADAPMHLQQQGVGSPRQQEQKRTDDIYADAPLHLARQRQLNNHDSALVSMAMTDPNQFVKQSMVVMRDVGFDWVKPTEQNEIAAGLAKLARNFFAKQQEKIADRYAESDQRNPILEVIENVVMTLLTKAEKHPQAQELHRQAQFMVQQQTGGDLAAPFSFYSSEAPSAYSGATSWLQPPQPYAAYGYQPQGQQQAAPQAAALPTPWPTGPTKLAPTAPSLQKQPIQLQPTQVRPTHAAAPLQAKPTWQDVMKNQGRPLPAAQQAPLHWQSPQQQALRPTQVPATPAPQPPQRKTFTPTTGTATPAQAVAPAMDPFRISASGRRRALLIGINYTNTKFALRGCQRDTETMKSMLTRVYGFPTYPSFLTVLTDKDGTPPELLPTRANMLKGFDWLAHGARPGDTLFLSYSGHGSQVTDKTGMESDGMNETILPLDWKQNGMIIDDELNKRLIQRLPKGCKFVAVMDCCHSGSALDLPYVYSLSQRDWRRKAFPAHSEADCILLSACQDSEKAADIQASSMESNKTGGAMTLALCGALAQDPFDLTFPEVLDRVHKHLRGKGLKQRPNLSSSIPFNLKTFKFNFYDIVQDPRAENKPRVDENSRPTGGGVVPENRRMTYGNAPVGCATGYGAKPLPVTYQPGAGAPGNIIRVNQGAKVQEVRDVRVGGPRGPAYATNPIFTRRS